MAKKITHSNRQKTGVKIGPIEFSQWNFILFLALSFILLVIVLNAMMEVSSDVRARASYGNCPMNVEAPRAEDCPGGKWTYKRGSDSCYGFFCEASGISNE